MTKKKGVLLINVGSPEAPTESAVREFLAEFLSDPFVIDYPPWLWKPLLNGVILKKRPAKSAELYQKIWDDGSPLIKISNSIAEKLAMQMQDHAIENHTYQRRMKEIIKEVKK